MASGTNPIARAVGRINDGSSDRQTAGSLKDVLAGSAIATEGSLDAAHVPDDWRPPWRRQVSRMPASLAAFHVSELVAVSPKTVPLSSKEMWIRDTPESAPSNASEWPTGVGTADEQDIHANAHEPPGRRIDHVEKAGCPCR